MHVQPSSNMVCWWQYFLAIDMKCEIVCEDADPPRFACSGSGSHPAAAVYPNGGDQHQAQQHQQAAGGLLGQDDLQQRLSAQLGSKRPVALHLERVWLCSLASNMSLFSVKLLVHTNKLKQHRLGVDFAKVAVCH